MAGKQGFEPRFHDPESCVLPLDDFPAGGGMIVNFLLFFNSGLHQLTLKNDDDSIPSENEKELVAHRDRGLTDIAASLSVLQKCGLE